MSVYTTITRDELVEFLAGYELGELQDYQGISQGIENTNYFVDTSAGRYVLTLFEWLGADELPYFLDLMAHLAEHDVPSAHPLPDKQGHYLRSLKDKPAALVYRLKGKMVEQANLNQLAVLGKELGHMHEAGKSFTGERENNRGPHWWRETARQVMDKLSTQDRELLETELHFQSLFRHHELPRGVIHADLFRDNALWVDDHLTGIIDFYYACNDVLLYDVAVTANDWCSQEDGELDEAKLLAFLKAYHQARGFTELERGAWPVMLRAGALRFWLSRLYDLHFPRPGEITNTYDPDVFKNILQKRIAAHDRLQNLWIDQ